MDCSDKFEECVLLEEYLQSPGQDTASLPPALLAALPAPARSAQVLLLGAQ